MQTGIGIEWVGCRGQRMNLLLLSVFAACKTSSPHLPQADPAQNAKSTQRCLRGFPCRGNMDIRCTLTGCADVGGRAGAKPLLGTSQVSGLVYLIA